MKESQPAVASSTAPPPPPSPPAAAPLAPPLTRSSRPSSPAPASNPAPAATAPPPSPPPPSPPPAAAEKPPLNNKSTHQSPSPTPPPPPPPLTPLPPPTEKMTVAGGRNSQKRQSKKQRPPLHPPPASAPASRLPLISPDDHISIPPSKYLHSSTSVSELAHLVKQQSYQEQKHGQSKAFLQKSLIANAVSARLTRAGELTHRCLVDNFKSDQKSDFATLYNAFHDVRNSCEANRLFAMLEPELKPSKGPSLSDENEGQPPPASFLHELPVQARNTILSFINDLRSDPSYLANRLCRLSNADLEALVRFHNQPSQSESILPQQASRRGVAHNRGSAYQGPLPSSVEKLLSFQRNDPLYTLMHTIFANSMGPDSPEDQRKLDVWATVCARLISENKGETFLLCVMDSWAATKDWPAKANLEICLMGLLQDGMFLVERADDQSAGRSADVRGKHDLLAEEFWTKAERKLFEVLDDEPSAGGIPDGILELGHAILEKLEDPKKQRQAEIMIMVKWFFNRFLANGIAYPEYHNIMTGHHISEHARLKILRPVLKKMYNHAVSVVFGEWKTSSPVEPIIRTHIENLLERFRCPRPLNTQPVLVPTKTVPSPPETAKVQPFLVLCPADIVTLCQSIFPHTPAGNVESRDIRKSENSRGSSRILAKSPGIMEIGGSVLSNSSSSVTSETASITAPLLDRASYSDDRRSFASLPSPSPSSFNMAPPSLAGSETATERVGPLDVRSAVEAMKGRLGADVVSGRCHPCAEKWAVLFVGRTGEELSLKMEKEWEDEDDAEDDDDDSDSDSDDGHGELSADREYEQLKQAVLKLVGEYEVPEEPAKQEKQSAEERPPLQKSHTTPASTSPPPPELDPSNPFHQSNLSNLSAMFARSQAKPPVADNAPTEAEIEHERQKKKDQQQQTPLLVTMLQAAYSQCYARGDYVSAQLYFRALIHLRKTAPSLQRDGYTPLLHIFSHGARRAIDKWAAALADYEHWFEWVTLANERLDSNVQGMMRWAKNLRDKMWYVTDVRNSAAYDEARNVSIALKKMAAPQRSAAVTKSAGRTHLTHRMSTSSFSLLKSDTLIDILAAPIDHGGPNKLSDDQATMTYEYLNRYSVENFCKGEERIHRFCLEVDKCVTKLVGDGILDGPVLWSSELFSRDEREMSINRQKGDLYLAGVGTLTVAGDEEYETDRDEGRTSSRRSLELLRRPSTSDLFGRNRSANLLGSLHDPSSRKGRTKSNSGLMDALDRQDVFGMPSPALPTESHNTFWSPFSSHGNHASSTGRPKTSHSPTTLSKSPEKVTHEKKKFLSELKQSLTGLLLSDLGLELFGQGSETDAWFSGGLGDECIQRKEEQDEAKRKAAERKRAASVSARRGLSKRKSMKNIRKEKTSGTFGALGKDKKGELAAPVATLETVAREIHSGEENSSSSDATARSSAHRRVIDAVKTGSLMSFPYGHAFRRLLLKFSTHPNPFQKLHALYELELLIVASLSQRSSRSSPEKLLSLPTSPFLGAMGDDVSRISNLRLSKASNIKETIQNVEERRSNVINNGAIGVTSGARSPTSPQAPNTDMIVDVLQSLFREADIRPQTLFRDLQFVAAFVPASVLDMTEVGKAFWDAGLAALGLKQDVCRTMVEIADEIVAGDSKRRGVDSSSKEKGGRDIDNAEYNRYSMQDAAKMWSITAKEGDPTAQRELAIFYLTNPSLLPRTTKPLSKPKDTFRPEMMVSKGEDPEKRDPATMCVAYHWMELSARGGDELAQKYLRSQREEW